MEVLSKTIACVLAIGLGSFFYLYREQPVENAPRPAWEITRAGSGLQVAWNLDAPELSKPLDATLVLRDGAVTRSFPLQERAGTLLMTTESSAVGVRARLAREGLVSNISLLRGNDPVVGLSLYQPGQDQPIALLTETLQTVEPVVTEDLRRRLGPKPREIEVFLKVNSEGKVSGTSTRYSDDALTKELSMLSTTAAMQWQFEPVTFAGKRVATDGKVSFWFSAKDHKLPVLTD